ncbi:thioredoxin-dependent thiol peroxidase [Magnetospira sp. QH-2]|uniref:thioredoxin-dependent thiol peroxidase n=1 Tax=Magnetospira sp. (strain QH-2) TaxID=1288970 RepID=UPI0003E811FD|nr:thioredoxin-dependent thiol peroxidase [Magnetospira sp. QH-2]CCQ72529.1 thiol peroxidase, thioredoxin-dependent [Magnetospira sp. QH-2]
MTIDVGDAAPPFDLPTDGEGRLTMAELSGKAVVLYFYPKDMTSGCTTQAEAFRDAIADYEAAGAVVVGVSKDPAKRHDKFKEKHDLPFTLIADEEGTLCQDYGVWKEKSMYGKKYMGIERSTFLIGADGKIVRVWRKVKVKGHVAEVLEAARELG